MLISIVGWAFTLLLAVATTSVFGQSSASSESVFVPRPRDPGPDVNRMVVLRLEKHRTCQSCPWYEVRVFEDGSTMFWGKEAVAFLGVDGTYAMPLGQVRPDVPPKLKSLLPKAQAVFDSTEQTASAHPGQLETLLRENRKLDRQAVEVELNLDKQTRRRVFTMGEHRELSQLASEIENLYLFAERRFNNAPRPVVFADPEMRMHLRTYRNTRDQCLQSNGLDALNITFYAGGWYRAEASRALWRSRTRDEDQPKLQGRLDAELVDSFRRQLLAERGALATFMWTPMSKNRNVNLHQDFGSATYRQRQRVTYVRRDDGTIVDLTVPIWDEWERRVPEWSPSLRRSLEDITSQIWSRFPPPDPELLAECRRRLPSK